MTERAKARIVWIDSLKLFACVLVVLGHFYMSLASAGWLSSDALYYCYPVQMVYVFHVPLFFVCSGYLYQRKQTDYSWASHWENIKNKALSLGVPYFVFSLITLALKIVFADSVNNQATPILRTVFWEPIAPYWYLYTLFFIFCLIPRQKHKENLLKTFCISLFVKIVYACIPWPFQFPDIIGKVASNAVWFAFGMLLTNPDYCRSILNRYIMAICFAIGIITSAIFYWQTNTSGGVQFLVGANFVYAFVCLFCKVMDNRGEKITRKLSKYFMPVYLMHTIAAAALRTLLLKIGINALPVHICAGLVASFILPALVYEVALKKWWLLFWFEPAKALKIRGNHNV